MSCFIFEPRSGAGYPTASGGVVDLPTDDYDGDARPVGSNTWDIGADQYSAEQVQYCPESLP